MQSFSIGTSATYIALDFDEHMRMLRQDFINFRIPAEEPIYDIPCVEIPKLVIPLSSCKSAKKAVALYISIETIQGTKKRLSSAVHCISGKRIHTCSLCEMQFTWKSNYN